MAIHITCSSCGTNLSFDEAQLGQSGPCYNCGQTIFVTAPPSPVAVAAAAMSAPAAPVSIPEVAPGSAQTKFLKKLGKEAVKTGHQVDGARVLQLREPVGFAESMKYKLTSKIPIDRIMGVFVRGPSGPFILSVPFSGSLVMAHEFASRVPGTLPANLYLTRGLMGAWSNGRFSANGDEEHPLARAAESKADLGELIEWNWENGKSVVKLGWGLQAVPASPNDTLHVMQTAVQGIVFKDIGLAWYEKRRAAFVEFQAQHGGPLQSEPRWDFEPYSLHFASAL